MSKRNVHTVPHGHGWANRREGADRVSEAFDTKREAESAGRETAKREGVEHLIHNKDGQIGERNSYGAVLIPRRARRRRPTARRRTPPSARRSKNERTTVQPRTPEEEHARTCGLRLLEISRVYEDAIVPPGAELGNLSIVGLVARQRRLLRGAYVLADAGLRLEAGMLVRTALEYLIVQKWLGLDPRLHHVLWVKDDLESRLRIDREIREGAPGEHEEAVELMEPERREQYKRSLDEMRAELARAQEELGLEKPPRYPPLIAQAAATGLRFAYTIAYRYESQVGVHPTPMAVEVLMEEQALGIQMKAEPPPEQGYADPYAVAAFVLRDALAAAAEIAPELHLDGFEEAATELEKVARPT